MTAPRTRGERGFALLIVLFTLVLLGFLITRFLSAGRLEMALAGNLRQAAIAGAAADGGIDWAIARLDDGAAVGHVVIGGVGVDVRIGDLAGRINPNSAPAALLAALIRTQGVGRNEARTIADAMVAWRSPAESPQAQAMLEARYRAAGRSAGPPGVAFASRQEIGGVMGMTPVLLARLMPHLSLFAPPVPRKAAADPAVRAALASAGSLDLPGGAVEGPRIVTIAAVVTLGAVTVRRCSVVRLSGANIETPFRVLRTGEAACQGASR